MWSLGQKLRGVREAKPGLSLRKLAARTHIDKRSLSLYERDKQDPPCAKLSRSAPAISSTRLRGFVDSGQARSQQESPSGCYYTDGDSHRRRKRNSAT